MLGYFMNKIISKILLLIIGLKVFYYKYELISNRINAVNKNGKLRFYSDTECIKSIKK